MSDFRHQWNIEDLKAWISQRLAKQEFSLWTNGLLKGVEIAWIDERCFDAETRQCVRKQIV